MEILFKQIPIVGNYTTGFGIKIRIIYLEYYECMYFELEKNNDDTYYHKRLMHMFMKSLLVMWEKSATIGPTG